MSSTSSIIDEIVQVSNEEAFDAARRLAREEGLPGRHLVRRGRPCRRSIASPPGKQRQGIVAILPDTGERYLSTPLFQDPDDVQI